ncbi:hypothetical protein F5I97DRAFT_1828994 [Phlebopus sp. FC_14]|nr:hypothetical protein F5I97DRAFT_1828994 [Phlebopus sp. FC_14]
MRFASLVICVLGVIGSAKAARLEPFLTHRIRALTDATIGKRQASTTVPSQCTSTCDPVNNEVNAGCPVTACCTPSFETAYYNCLECVGVALNATDYSTAQQYLNELWVTCEDMGYDLPELALPGQSTGTAPTITATATAPLVQPPASTSSTSALTSTGTFSSTATPSPTSTPTNTATKIGGGVWHAKPWAIVGVVLGAGILI